MNSNVVEAEAGYSIFRQKNDEINNAKPISNVSISIITILESMANMNEVTFCML